VDEAPAVAARVQANAPRVRLGSVGQVEPVSELPLGLQQVGEILMDREVVLEVLLSRRKLRVSIGAVCSLPIVRATAWPADLSALRGAGFRLTGTCSVSPRSAPPRSVVAPDLRRRGSGCSARGQPTRPSTSARTSDAWGACPDHRRNRGACGRTGRRRAAAPRASERARRHHRSRAPLAPRRGRSVCRERGRRRKEQAYPHRWSGAR